MDNARNVVCIVLCQVDNEFKLQNGLVTCAESETTLQKHLDIWSQNYDIRILTIKLIFMLFYWPFPFRRERNKRGH